MDAASLDQLTSAYREPQIVFTALRLGIFELLDERPLEAGEIADRLEIDRRASRILCDALVALELLEKRDGHYRNEPVATEVLVRSSPRSKVDRYLLGARQYERWGGLLEAVREGGGRRAASPNDERPRAFAAAMADVGRESAAKLLQAIDLSGVGQLLDVGGGPGVYAITLAERHPGLEAVVLDRRETLEVARENIAAHGLEDRVRTLAADAFSDDLGGPYDFILISNFLHMFGADEIRPLIGRCAATLAPGGRLCVKDFLLDDDRTSPAGSTLFAVNMLISTESGDCFTERQISGWLAEAGLAVEERIDLTELSGLVLARRPTEEMSATKESAS